jgi:hypothetical protein
MVADKAANCYKDELYVRSESILNYNTLGNSIELLLASNWRINLEFVMTPQVPNATKFLSRDSGTESWSAEGHKGLRQD